jgi:hypothetical protein
MKLNRYFFYICRINKIKRLSDQTNAVDFIHTPGAIAPEIDATGELNRVASITFRIGTYRRDLYFSNTYALEP